MYEGCGSVEDTQLDGPSCALLYGRDRELPVVDASDFDYETAQPDEIMELADELPGLRLGEIPGASFLAVEATKGKGEAGAAVEAYFGILPNQISDADFPGAKIELKTVPLEMKAHGLHVKERTVISMIDYFSLAAETWSTASVRKKLHILFVFFEHLADRPKADFPIVHVSLWRPEDQVEAQIKADWETVRQKVLDGRAHELSEADGRMLGPCTKGADSTHLKSQPFSDEKARSRAFALKPAFTFGIYMETQRVKASTKRLAELANLDRLLRGFEKFVGRAIGDVAAELDTPPSTAKNYTARVVGRALSRASEIDEAKLEAAVTVRVPRVNPALAPYEAVSFPSFRHTELAEEDWEDSDLLSRVEQLLLVPVMGAKRQTPPDDCVIQTPVHWIPTVGELATIEREWITVRNRVRSEQAHKLPKESQTQAIHVRPHGKDAGDTDPTPGGGEQTKKSFWLNKDFVQRILKERRELDGR